MNSPRLALVKWLDSSSDNGKYTIGVPITWIRDFDMKRHYLCDDPNESYVIEWRCGKNFRDGWQCFNAVILYIAEKKSILEKLFKNIGGELSSKEVLIPLLLRMNENSEQNIQESRPQEHDDDETKRLDEPVSENRTKRAKRNVDENPPYYGSSSDSDTRRAPIKKRKYKQTYRRNLNGNLLRSIYKSLRSLQNQNFSNQDISDNNKLKEKKIVPNDLNKIFEAVMKNRKILMKNQKIMMDIDENVKALKYSLKKSISSDSDFDEESVVSSNETTNLPSTSSQSMPNMIEVGPKSGKRIPLNKWKSAISKSTYKSMGTSLLKSMFTLDELLESSVKGGSSKLTLDGQRILRKSLDRDKLEDLMNAVKKHHAQTFDEPSLIVALNCRMCILRRQHGKE